MKTKQIVNAVVGVLAGLLGAVSIVTQMIADKDDKETMYEELEDRYGLTPRKNEEGAD